MYVKSFVKALKPMVLLGSTLILLQEQKLLGCFGHKVKTNVKLKFYKTENRLTLYIPIL